MNKKRSLYHFSCSWHPSWGVGTGTGTGTAGLLNSIFTIRQFSLELTQQVIRLAEALGALQEQVPSLAGLAVQNHRA